MEYGNVPHFDKPISRIVLGIIPLKHDDLPHSFAIIDRYRELGGNMIDNSVVYGGGFMSMMKAYYESRGEDALIRLDKGCHHRGEGDEGRRVTKKDLDEDVRANLEGQGVTYSDFFVLHRDDRRVPAGEIVEWLNEHKAAGRIRAFGGSNWHHTRIAEANEYAEKHGLQGFSLSSPNLSLATVNEPMWWEAYSIDREGREWHERTGFPLFSWSSAGGGWFAEVDSDNVNRVYRNEENVRRLARAKEMAAQKGVTPYQIALAWTLNQPLNVFALTGPDTIPMLEMNMATADLGLTPPELNYLENGQ
jgi:aryl-alcohol dehydrogenase-like predicted oxidoreductase